MGSVWVRSGSVEIAVGRRIAACHKIGAIIHSLLGRRSRLGACLLFWSALIGCAGLNSVTRALDCGRGRGPLDLGEFIPPHSTFAAPRLSLSRWSFVVSGICTIHGFYLPTERRARVRPK